MKDAARVLKALADPTRLRIMLLLRRRQLCVCELVFVLDMEQSRVSHHMRALREAGLAEDLRQGRWIVYRIPPPARGLVAGLFAGPLRERLESGGEADSDRRRLAACVRDNIRGRVCGAGPLKGRT